MVRQSGSFLPPAIANKRSSSLSTGSGRKFQHLAVAAGANAADKRSWQQRIQFWRSGSKNEDREGTSEAEEEEDEDTTSPYEEGGSLVSRFDDYEEEEDEESSSSSSTTSTEESLGRSYVTGDGDGTYITNDEEGTLATNDGDGEDGAEEQTMETLGEDDEEIGAEDALKNFVGGVLFQANRSFLSFMAGGNGIVESSSAAMQQQQQHDVEEDDEEESEEDATAIEYDAATYNGYENSVINYAASFAASGLSGRSRATATTVEGRLTSNLKLVQGELQGGGSTTDENNSNDDYDCDNGADGRAAKFGNIYPSVSACSPFESFRVLNRHESRSSVRSVRLNRSFASGSEEATFLQMQEKLRETQREKLIRSTQSLGGDTHTSLTPTINLHDKDNNVEEDNADQGNLMRDVFDNLPFFGCVPRRPLFDADDDDDDVEEDDEDDGAQNETARTVDDDVNTNAYETSTEYDEEEEEEEEEEKEEDVDAESSEQQSNAYDTATYGDEDYDTNADDTRYDNVMEDVEDNETQGYETQDYETNLDSSQHKKKKFALGRSLRRGLEGLRYGNLNRLYQTTDESSVGSGMDQSHIYLMMTSARRQRTMQQRTQQQRNQQQQRGSATTRTAKMGVQPHHSQWMSQARPQIIAAPPPVVAPPPPRAPPTEQASSISEKEAEAARQKRFLDVGFVNSFVQGIINTNHTGSTSTNTEASRLLKLQATKEIQDRWIREIQMTTVTAGMYAPDPERQRAAQEALARIREDYIRRQPLQHHHFRLSTSSNHLYGAGGSLQQQK